MQLEGIKLRPALVSNDMVLLLQTSHREQRKDRRHQSEDEVIKRVQQKHLEIFQQNEVIQEYFMEIKSDRIQRYLISKQKQLNAKVRYAAEYNYRWKERHQELKEQYSNSSSIEHAIHLYEQMKYKKSIEIKVKLPLISDNRRHSEPGTHIRVRDQARKRLSSDSTDIRDFNQAIKIYEQMKQKQSIEKKPTSPKLPVITNRTHSEPKVDMKKGSAKRTFAECVYIKDAALLQRSQNYAQRLEDKSKRFNSIKSIEGKVKLRAIQNSIETSAFVTDLK